MTTRAEEQEGVAQRDRDADPEGRLDLGGVGGEPRHDLAALGAVEEGRIEGGQMPEHRRAKIRHHPLAQRDDEIEAGRARGRENADDQSSTAK